MFLVFFLLNLNGVWGCTSMIFGAKATVDGHPMTSHAADCNSCDNRIAFVPPQEKGASTKPLYDGLNSYFPREISEGRSSVYEPTEEYPSPFEPVGYIEVPETKHAMWESAYPLINQYGLSIGESTTSAKDILANAMVGSKEASANGDTGRTGLMVIAQLMTVAMEQCKDAVCAIKTMGFYAQKYGFVGESYGASEAVTVVDTQQAWVFEVNGDGQGGAIWAAQRVPENHVAVISNTCIIKEVHTDDPANYLFSDNLHSVAEAKGLWSAGEGRLLNWQRDIGKPIILPRYSSLRTWRVFSRVAASQNIENFVDPFDIPFSVPVDEPVSLQKVFDLFSDHYEGTEFDMTQGALAGMHGDPNYEMSGQDIHAVEGGGQIPRAMSLHRTSYTMIAVPKLPFPAVWYAVDAPATSVWVPFYADALSEGKYSDRYGTQTAPRLQKFDRYSAFWAFDFVANYMGLNYRNMSSEMVLPKREELQTWVLQKAVEGELEAAASKAEGEVLGRVQTNIQEHVAASWWQLADDLVVRYNDGYFNFPEGVGKYEGVSHTLPKPVEWLKMIGFSQDFYRPALHWVQPFFKFDEENRSEEPKERVTSTTYFTSYLFTTLMAIALSGLGFLVGRIFERREANGRKMAEEREGNYVRIL